MGFASAAGGHDLSAAWMFRADPAVPVLLDGDYLVQAEWRIAQLQGAQSVLDLLPDIGSREASAFRHGLPSLVDDDDVGRDRRHLHFAAFKHARGLRDRTAALQGQSLRRPWHLSRVP